MPRTIKLVKLDSATARKRLKTGRQPHWQALAPGVHLGWQRWPHDPTGRWMLRRLIDGNYTSAEISKADDNARADGRQVLDHAQAQQKARDLTSSGIGGKTIRMTVRQAADVFLDFKKSEGQDIGDLKSRITCHILPHLGHMVIEELDAARLRRWLADMAAQPAQVRPTSDGKLQWQPAAKTEDEKRARRNTANRVMNILKAMLNHVYDEGHVSSNDAWGRKLKNLKNAEGQRLRYLEPDECKRLLNAADADFRPLVRAGLETECRYGELIRLQIHDFNKTNGSVFIAKSKSGKARHVLLTDEGAAFFKQHCIGRDRSGLMFTKTDGSAWTNSDQIRRIDAVCDAARIKPRCTFHALRHTWASLAVMNGMPLLLVARNLGHADTRMCEKHYAHLSPSYESDMIRATAPRFGQTTERHVVAMK
jgi:integrase